MKSLLFVFIVLGTLALFNPSPDDFTAFVQDRARDVVSEHGRAAGGEFFGGVAGALAGEVAGAIAGGSVERDNYLLASTYSLDLNGIEEEGGEWRFLAIGGQFFEVERPAELEG
jgi:hypothetical protein